MRHWIIGLLITVVSMPVLANPMQPPAEALRKMRSIKQAPSVPAKPKTESAVTTKSAPFTLHSILSAADREVAIINDQALVVGQTIQGASLMRIEKDHVRLKRKGKTWILRLPKAGAESIRIQR